MVRRRRYGRRRGHKAFKIPVISLAILGAQLVWAGAGTRDIKFVATNMASAYTGYDFGRLAFDPGLLLLGYGPWVAKGVAMKIARAVGGAPRMPFGLPFSLT